jgi:hypothetical protein
MGGWTLAVQWGQKFLIDERSKAVICFLLKAYRSFETALSPDDFWRK